MSKALRVLCWAGALLVLVCAVQTRASDTPEHTGQVLPANTEVHLKLLEAVASNTHKHGDRFALEVVEPVVVEGTTLIPAGSKGEGEVVHAAKAGFGGRGGELILVSRFVRVGEQSIRLRSFSAGKGKDRVDLALGLSLAVVGIFVTGKNIAIPAGTDVFAKVAVDSPVSPAASIAPATADHTPSAVPNLTNGAPQE